MSTENTTQATGTVTESSAPAASTAAATESVTPAASTEAVSTAPQTVEQTIKGKKAAQVAPPAYTPNYKFKVHDEEKEIDELFRGLIKDQETEKKVREFHEKAFGLDVQKPKFEKLKTEFQAVNEKYTNIDNSLKQLSSYVRENDLGSFFEAVNIPKEMVFSFVKKELEKMGAPPEQRAQMEEFERIRKENLALKQQTESLSSRFESESLQAKVMELDTALARPDVAQMSALYEAKVGKKGAFKDAVIERGLLVYHTTGQQIPVAQAVQETLAQWTPFLQQGQPAAPVAQAPKATLPNVGGRSASPIKQGVRSMDDLYKAQARIVGS